jgi:hypothetical protein
MPPPRKEEELIRLQLVVVSSATLAPRNDRGLVSVHEDRREISVH